MRLQLHAPHPDASPPSRLVHGLSLSELVTSLLAALTAGAPASITNSAFTVALLTTPWLLAPFPVGSSASPSPVAGTNRSATITDLTVAKYLTLIGLLVYQVGWAPLLEGEMYGY
ncbi:hypothetical protein PC111_g14638 [Phytophthora cactorum]|nr:hypothetical protein PC111_g14638 [Phytophthora cactorum]